MSDAPGPGRRLVAAGRRWGRSIPVPAGAGLARVVLERDLVAERKSLRSLVSGFLEPVFYLLSLGLGLGVLVGNVPVEGGRESSVSPSPASGWARRRSCAPGRTSTW